MTEFEFWHVPGDIGKDVLDGHFAKAWHEAIHRIIQKRFERPVVHGDSVLELLHVPRQKFNRLICSRACILVAAEICWRWSRRAWHAWCTNLSETLYEYIYGRSIYTPDSGSMVSDVRRVE